VAPARHDQQPKPDNREQNDVVTIVVIIAFHRDGDALLTGLLRGECESWEMKPLALLPLRRFFFSAPLVFSFFAFVGFPGAS
jgi:hypothetical protein